METRHICFLTSYNLKRVINTHKAILKKMRINHYDMLCGETYVKGGRALCCITELRDADGEIYQSIRTYMDENCQICTQINTIEDELPF